MKTIFDANIRLTENIARYFLGALLIGLVMVVPFAPVWLALLAIYPIVTAIISWDPVYAAGGLLKTILVSPQGFGGRLAVK